jgi:hypothetical protein
MCCSKKSKKVHVPFSRTPALQLCARPLERNGMEERCWAVVGLNRFYSSHVYVPSAGRGIGATCVLRPPARSLSSSAASTCRPSSIHQTSLSVERLCTKGWTQTRVSLAKVLSRLTFNSLSFWSEIKYRTCSPMYQL